MTNFLSSLIDRALERAPLLERRRPSPFEPVAGPAGYGLGRTDEATPYDLEEVAQSEPTALPRYEPSPYRPITPNPPSTLARERELYDTPASQSVRPPASAHPSAMRDGLSGQDFKGEASAVTPRGKAAEPGVAPTEMRMMETIVERRVIEKVVEERVERPAVRLAQPPPMSAERESAMPTLKPPARDGVAQDRAAQARRRLPSQHARPALTREAPPAAPPVQVTIGRIEVRATPPARAPRGQAPPAPKLSLEDYLRSRGGGSQ